MDDNTDDIWGLEEETPSREWSKMDEEFTNAGYREGITAGKESALQEGFDDGFDNVGAPLGREIGILRGVASAAMNLFSPTESRLGGRPKNAEKWKEELRLIIRDLGRIHLADLAPRDIQAEEHAREHLEGDPSGDIHVTVDQAVNGTHTSKLVDYQLKSLNGDPLLPRPAVEELQRLRVRLSEILKDFELDISLE